MSQKIEEIIVKAEKDKYFFARICSVVIVLIVAATLCYIVNQLAGKTTVSSIAFNFLADIKFAASIVWGIASTGLYYREKKSKQKIIQEKASIINDLQKIIDEGKGTSNLEKNGITNYKDRE